MIAETEVRKTERNCLVVHFLCSATNAPFVCIEMLARGKENVGNCRAVSRNRLADSLLAFSHFFDVIATMPLDRFETTQLDRFNLMIR